MREHLRGGAEAFELPVVDHVVVRERDPVDQNTEREVLLNRTHPLEEVGGRERSLP